MRRLIHINSLYTPVENQDIGTIIFYFVLARDIDNGEYLYYTHLDKNGIYQGEHYYRLFDINNPDELTFIKQLFNMSILKREQNTKELPIELIKAADILSTKHIEYNLNNNFTNKNLLFNIRNLILNYNDGNNLFGITDYKGAFKSELNTIKLTINKDDWKKLSDKKKKEHYYTLLHEIGHLKCTSLTLNNGIIISKTGFIKQFKEPIIYKTEDNDIYYLSGFKRYDTREIILEEMYNCLECSEIDSNYNTSYPNYWNDLDKITDGKLRRSRYDGSIDDYYELFEENIGTRKEAEELLDCMYTSIKDKKYRDEPFKLLKTYKCKK